MSTTPNQAARPLGTPAVLIGVTVVVLLQLAFTYAPPLQLLFDTRPVSLLDGAVILGAGVALLVLLEMEKLARRQLRIAAAA